MNAVTFSVHVAAVRKCYTPDEADQSVGKWLFLLAYTVLASVTIADQQQQPTGPGMLGGA